MALKADHRDLPKAHSTATYPSLFRDVIADFLLALREAEGEKPMSGEHARIRHSWAGMCAARIGYSVQGATPEPDEPESLWSFQMGHRAHELVQEAFKARYGDQCKVEFGIDLGERAGTIDLAIFFDTVTPFTVDGVTHLCKTVCIELKSTGGYSWSLQVKQEGPKVGAYLQGCLNAAGIDADLLVIGYLALDRQTATARKFYGMGRKPLDAVWATWAYPRDQYMRDAGRESHRLEEVLKYVDAGKLPPRQVPELPKGARITDPKDGSWQVLDDEGNMTGFGSYWGCNYCPHQQRCIADAKAEAEQ